jgi:hypothetical protein
LLRGHVIPKDFTFCIHYPLFHVNEKRHRVTSYHRSYGTIPRFSGIDRSFDSPSKEGGRAMMLIMKLNERYSERRLLPQRVLVWTILRLPSTLVGRANSSVGIRIPNLPKVYPSWPSPVSSLRLQLTFAACYCS